MYNQITNSGNSLNFSAFYRKVNHQNLMSVQVLEALFSMEKRLIQVHLF